MRVRLNLELSEEVDYFKYPGSQVAADEVVTGMWYDTQNEWEHRACEC